MARELFSLNPQLDRGALAERFKRDGRVQVRDVLTEAAAAAIHEILAQATPWGLAWQAGSDGPHAVRATALKTDPAAQQQIIAAATTAAA